jgi:SAM-dependent methyltransferase
MESHSARCAQAVTNRGASPRDQVCCSLVDDERRLARARTFDQIAELYDRARPYYREEMFDDLFQLAGLEPASTRILEIGCGTGRATEPLARRGADIVCRARSQPRTRRR